MLHCSYAKYIGLFHFSFIRPFFLAFYTTIAFISYIPPTFLYRMQGRMEKFGEGGCLYEGTGGGAQPQKNLASNVFF